jgi:hypothetical protein
MKMKSITPNWKPFERRPTWSVVTSRELAQVLGVSLQTINNWKMRFILPEPEPHSGELIGNRNYYKISKIRSWLENRPEDEIHWEWVHRWISPLSEGIERLGQADFLVTSIPHFFSVEKPLLPGNFIKQASNTALGPVQDQNPASS